MEERRGEERRGEESGEVFKRLTKGGRKERRLSREGERQAPSLSLCACDAISKNLPVCGVAPTRNEVPLPNDVTGDESHLPAPPPIPKRVPMDLGGSPPTPAEPILPWPRVWLRSPTPPAEDDAERAAGSVPTIAAAERKRKGREGG